MNPAPPNCPESSPATATDRRHDLDALRGVAMLLGIVLHGSLAYTTFSVWAVHDVRTHPFFDTLFTAIHGFRMQLFFVVSGFFTAMLWRKRGLAAVFKQRALRILLPLALFVVPLPWLSEKVISSLYAHEAGQSAAVTLWTAARDNDLAALQRQAASGADLNERDPQFQVPPLNWAALNGSLEAAQWLIKAGAKVDVASSDDSTPLSHAAFTGRADIAALLIDCGAAVNSVNQHQSTPLNNAGSDWGVVEWVAGTLKLKVDKPAVEAGHRAIIALLKEHGGKTRSELEPPGAGATKPEAALDPVSRAYLGFTRAPLFGKFQIFGHLWFLWFLCLLLVPFGLYAWLVAKLNWRAGSRSLFKSKSPLLLLWLVPLAMIPQWFHSLSGPGFGPDTSTGVFPLPHVLALYAVYFFFGVLYFDTNDSEARLCRHWWLMLPVALFIVFPLGRSLLVEPQSARVPSGAVRPLAVLMQVLYSWLMILGLTGFFRKMFTAENRTARYLSDSAYFLYLLHLPLIFVPQYFMKLADLPAAAKFAVVCVSTTAVLLLVYQLWVRYTVVGTLLNGKRRRPAKG